jgi:hypothetical protein
MADDTEPAAAPESLPAEQLSAVRLPPKPDPETGQPFPPHAPAYTSTDKGDPDSDPNRDTSLKGRLRPPAGQGPTLASYQASRRKALSVMAWVFALITLGLFVVRGFTTDWMHFWWGWVAIAAISALAYPIVMKESSAAGAEWVMMNKAWVRTYELISVKAYTYSNSLNLHLVDRDGRKLQTNISRLQDDRRIWDLAYNGILHSVVGNGADTNQLARKSLKLP